MVGGFLLSAARIFHSDPLVVSVGYRAGDEEDEVKDDAGRRDPAQDAVVAWGLFHVMHPSPFEADRKPLRSHLLLPRTHQRLLER